MKLLVSNLAAAVGLLLAACSPPPAPMRESVHDPSSPRAPEGKSPLASDVFASADPTNEPGAPPKEAMPAIPSADTTMQGPPHEHRHGHHGHDHGESSVPSASAPGHGAQGEHGHVEHGHGGHGEHGRHGHEGDAARRADQETPRNAKSAPARPSTSGTSKAPAPPAATSPAASASGAQGIYVCPMHPDVTSAAPGDCPKCGMHLVPKAQLPKTNPTP